MFEEFVFMGMIMGFSMSLPAIYMWRFMMNKWYPVKVPVQMQRGNSIVWDFKERAASKRNRKTGYEYYILKRRKLKIKPPKYGELSIDRKGKPVFPMFETARGQLMATKTNPPNMDIVKDAGRLNWGIGELQKTANIYQNPENKLAKWMPYIMNATLAGLIAFLVLFVLIKFEVIAGQLSGASNALANAMNMFVGAQGG